MVSSMLPIMARIYNTNTGHHLRLWTFSFGILCAVFCWQVTFVSARVGLYSSDNVDQKRIGQWQRNAAGKGDLGAHAHELPICKTVRVTKESAVKFFTRLANKHANFAFMTVASYNDSLITWSKDADVLFRTVWIWTILGEGGAFPYVWYAHDFYSLSSGLLDKRTAHGIKLNLTTDSHTPCRLKLGEHNSTQTIATAFNEMMQPSYKDFDLYKNSVFCYTVKYNSYGVVMTYITHLLGIEKGYTGYRCCYQHASNRETDNVTTHSRCENRIQVMTKWYCVLYVLVFIIFFYCPFVFVPIAARINVTDSMSDCASVEGYEPLPTEQNIQMKTERRTRCPKRHQWIYLGVDKPITLLKVLCKPFYRCHTHPKLASKLQRFLVLLLTPSVIALQLYMYRESITKQFWIQRRLNNNIPVGFLAVPFGFEYSRKNWMGLFGGPYVMYFIYFSAGLIVLLLPRSISGLITSFLKRESRSHYTLLSIDLMTIEKWSITTFGDLSGYQLISKVLLANFYMLMNKKFWRFAKRRIIDGAETINRFLDDCFGGGNCCTRIVCVLLKLLIFSIYFILRAVEIFCCLCFYGLPAVCLTVSILRGYVIWTKRVVRSSLLRLLLGIFVCLVTMHSLIGFAVLFICSAIYAAQVINFTYIGILIYPEYTVGYVIGAGTLAYYIVGNIRKFNDKFSNLLSMTVEASMVLEKRRKQSSCKLEEKAIVLSGECTKNIEVIAIPDGAIIQLTEEQKAALTKGQYRTKPFVKWRHDQPGIPYQLFRYVMRRFCPLHVEVFWFMFRLAVFCLIVMSIVTLLMSYNISSNLAIPAQMITAISLNVLPRVRQLFVSSLDIRLDEEHRKRRLETAVNEYWDRERLILI